MIPTRRMTKRSRLLCAITSLGILAAFAGFVQAQRPAPPMRDLLLQEEEPPEQLITLRWQL